MKSKTYYSVFPLLKEDSTMKLPHEQDFEQINLKLDYLGVKGIERDEQWTKELMKLKGMISVVAWMIVLSWLALGGWLFVNN
jgi:hypothetical protein